MKGISLSINAVIVLVVGLVVLLALLVMFKSSVTPGGETMKWQSIWNAECSKYIASGGCDEGKNVNPTEEMEEAGKHLGITDYKTTCCRSTTTTTTLGG